MYPILETERLILKPLQDSDFEDMFKLNSNPTVLATMEGKVHNNPEIYKKEFLQAVSSGAYLTLRLRNSDCFIGFILLYQYIKQDKVSYSQIGTALLPEYWGQGYATEATHKLLNFAFLGIKTPWLCANQFQDNPAAGIVLKKCGLRFFKTFKMQNRLYDQYRYKIDEYLTDNDITVDSDSPYNYFLNIQPKEVKVSPYSYEKPVRKIDHIGFIEQPTEYLCGQSVIAMLAGVPVDEIIDVMQNDKGTSTSELRDALKYYGLKTATKARLKYTEEIELPDCCILSVKLPDYGHWSLYYKGKFYDPEFGVLDKLPEQANLRYYWEVLTK